MKILNKFTDKVIFENTNADLRYANLRYANLQGANLRYANLQIPRDSLRIFLTFRLPVFQILT